MNLIISHIADIDGVSPVILGKLTFGKIDYELYDIYEVDNVINKHLDNNDFDKYENVFITDLSVNYDVVKRIQEMGLGGKVKIFDHHIISEQLAEFDFSYSAVKVGDKLTCGTALFYQYLQANYKVDILNKESVNEFVELVRLNDTWDWQRENKTKARDLAGLHILYGNETFIDTYTKYLTDNDIFDFTDKEKFLLEMENKRKADYIKDKESKIIEATLLGHPVGVVFAELYRSELGNDLAIKFQDKYDFIVIMNMDRLSVSYRGIKDINLADIASCFGGHGHFKASGSPISKEAFYKVLEDTFNDKIEIKK